MAVSLTVTTEDAALEGLLRYLDTHGSLDTTEKIGSWKRAQRGSGLRSM